MGQGFLGPAVKFFCEGAKGISQAPTFSEEKYISLNARANGHINK